MLLAAVLEECLHEGRLATARSDGNGGDGGDRYHNVTRSPTSQLFKRTDEDLLYSSGSVLYDSRGSESDLIL